MFHYILYIYIYFLFNQLITSIFYSNKDVMLFIIKLYHLYFYIITLNLLFIFYIFIYLILIILYLNQTYHYK